VSPIFLPRISAFIAHLLIVAVRVQVSKHDAAESYQRSLTLFVREQTPELDERHRPDNGRARGGRWLRCVVTWGTSVQILDVGFNPFGQPNQAVYRDYWCVCGFL
jgi:hypothetical protein